MAYRLSQVRLLVSDFKGCFRFYKEVMRLPVGMGDENGGYASFGVGGADLALFGRQAMADAVGTANRPSDALSQDGVAIVLEVEDVDREYRRLKTKGVTFITEPADREQWGIRTAHLRDSDGNLIEIIKEL